MTEPSFTGLLGRERELGELRAALRSARAGRPGAVLVGGDAGVGKTRLVAELVRHAAGEGVIVLSGAAVDIADAPPFWPVLSAVRTAARRQRSALLTGWAAELRDAGRPGAGRPVQLLELLYRMVEELADDAPVLLVVEDLQWADQSTRDLVSYLVATLVDEPVLVVATVRTPGAVVALAELRRLHNVGTVAVEPLPRAVVADLVRRWAPGRPGLDRLVWQRSGGNAFIAEETVRAVLDGDASGLPGTLRDIVLSRVALLTPPAQQVVRALATGVGPVHHRLLEDVLDLEPRALDAALREAIGSGIVGVDDERERYALHHGLTAEVVGEDLLPGERMDLHKRFALALAGGRDPGTSAPDLAATVAHHWHEADDPDQALPASVAAALAAEAVHAHTEAHRHWMRAAALVGRVSDGTSELGRVDCLDRAAGAAALAGDHDEAVALLEGLLADPDTAAGATPALLTARIGSSLAAAGRTGEARRRYRTAADLLPAEGAEAERAQVLAGYCAALLRAMDFAGARSVAHDALVLARAAGAPGVEARVLTVLGFSAAYLDDTETGTAAIEQAWDVAQRTGDPEALGEAWLRRAELVSGPLNRLVEGLDLARSGVERMRELGLSRTVGAGLLVNAANALFRLGRWDEADRTIAEAAELGPAGSAAIEVRLARIRLELGRGELESAAAGLDAVGLLASTATGPRERIPLLVLGAALELWRADPVAALERVAAGLAVVESGADDIWALAPLVWHGTRAWADVVAAGHPPPDPALTGRLRAQHDALVERSTRTVPAVRAVVEAFTQMCTAEITRAGRSSDADAWSRAVALWDRHHQPYPATYARLRHAEALLVHRPRSAAAAERLREADRAARELRARPLLDAVRDLASRCGIDLATTDTAADPAPREPAAPGPLDALTPRERTVLAELTEGRTNREIAGRLFISEKTVGVHVGRILSKLGVHSRVQATAMVLRSRPPGPAA